MSDLDTRLLRAMRPAAPVLHLAHDSGGPSDPRLLAGMTLLMFGGGPAALTDYRSWAAEGGGLALQIGNDEALADWLARHHFVRTAVLIDDDTLSTEAGLSLAATIRRLRPDVPVLLLLAPGAPEVSPATPGPSFAVDRRPLTRTGFLRAMEIARMLVGVDRELLAPERPTPPRLVRPADVLLDAEDRPTAAPWLVPMMLGGLLAWALLAVMLL